MTDSQTWQLHCPVPIHANSERITLAHGEGSRLTRQLIAAHILSRFDNPVLASLSDAAHVSSKSTRLAITTDSYVVSPLFFPGGDIGSLAVHGTVNDLAVSGAKPRWLTVSLILEEGLPIPVLERVLDSIATAARSCGVSVVAGDTKVVPRGAADGLFLNTTGVGELIDPLPTGPQTICEGDAILVTGPIGQHGIAVLCAREELGFDPPPESDSAPLIEAVAALRTAIGADVRAIRDATRGGVAAVLHEWAGDCGLTMSLVEQDVPVSPVVHGACELLGLDPLHVANEGTMVCAVAPHAVQHALDALRTIPMTANTVCIGGVTARKVAAVTIRRTLGSEQAVDDPMGAPLPRIC